MGKKSDSFTAALASLLKSRGLKVPAGLTAAPPEAYAAQPATLVDLLANLSDAELSARAEKVAGFAKRQADRAKQAWETSPLILEIKRRKLEVPKRPQKVVGFAYSVKKPLMQWSDDELLDAAEEWARLGAKTIPRTTPRGRKGTTKKK